MKTHLSVVGLTKSKWDSFLVNFTESRSALQELKYSFLSWLLKMAYCHLFWMLKDMVNFSSQAPRRHLQVLII